MTGRFTPLVRCPGHSGSCESLIEPHRIYCGECAQRLRFKRPTSPDASNHRGRPVGYPPRSKVAA